MVVQMTRAEYQAKYGTPAPASTTPVKMTRAEYQAKYGAPPPAPAAQPAAPAQPQGYVARVGQNLKDAYDQRTADISNAKDAQARGEQTGLETAAQAGGSFIGAGFDTLLAPLKALPDKVKSTVGSIAGKVAGGVARAVTGVPAPILQKAASVPLKTVPDKVSNIPAVQQFAQAPASQRLERNIQAGQEYASLIPSGKAGSVAGEAAGKVIGAAADVAKDAAAPVVAKAGKGATSIASIASGVPREVIERAADPEHATMIDKAIAHISENEKQPFLDLAHRATESIGKVQRIAASKLAAAKQAFHEEFPKETFNVQPKIPQIVAALKPFRSSGLIVDQTKDEAGKVIGHTISRTAQSPFSDREINALNSLLAKMRASKDVSVDDLLALRQSFNRAYHDIPLGNNQEALPYHAVVTALKKAAEPAINEILPPSLRQAFRDYSDVEDMKLAIGNKIADGNGDMKHTAEQYLSNLVNTNKGATREDAELFKGLTGLDLVREAQAVKDAQKLSPIFASTGSRTQDIVRALFASGIGGASLGPLGMAAGLAATSPKAVGKAALSIGKYLARKDAQKASSELSSKVLDTPSALSATKNITNPNMKVIPKSVPRKGPLDIWPDHPPF